MISEYSRPEKKAEKQHFPWGCGTFIYLFTLHPNHSPLHLTLFSHAPVPFSLGKMDPSPALYQSALAHWVASLRPDKAAQLARERDPKAETESE